MLVHDLEGRGISDRRVLAAMGEVPREEFVAWGERGQAYADRPLPIGHGQTISQPYIVALMLELAELRPDDRLLEVGAGCGYAAAVASRLCAEVVGIERVTALARDARARLVHLGYRNVVVLEGDGTVGWPPGAPFDAIVVSAGAPEVPEALVGQLADGGRLVVPAGTSPWGQQLLRLRRVGGQVEEEDLGGVSFVPLIGAQGWEERSQRG